MTKCCGYGEFMLVYKDYTLADLYKQACLQFSVSSIQLFLDGPWERTRERIAIPNTDVITVRQFILENPAVPIYPVDIPVVYRIWYDSGHSCVGRHSCTGGPADVNV